MRILLFSVLAERARGCASIQLRGLTPARLGGTPRLAAAALTSGDDFSAGQ